MMFGFTSGNCDETGKVAVFAMAAGTGSGSYTFVAADGSAAGNEVFFACDVG